MAWQTCADAAWTDALHCVAGERGVRECTLQPYPRRRAAHRSADGRRVHPSARASSSRGRLSSLAPHAQVHAQVATICRWPAANGDLRGLARLTAYERYRTDPPILSEHPLDPSRAGACLPREYYFRHYLMEDTQ